LFLVFLAIAFTRQKFFWLIVFVLCFWGGCWRYNLVLPDCANDDDLCFYNNQDISFIATVGKSFRNSGRQSLFASEVVISGKKSHGQALLYATAYPQFDYGDKIRVRCRLTDTNEIDVKGYVRYLARYDIYAYCQKAEISFLSSDDLAPTEKFFRLRRWLSGRVNQALPEPASALVRGMILGGGDDFSQYYKNIFSQLGLTHVIAISGSHMVVVVMILMVLFIGLGLSRPKAFWPIVAMVFLYTALVGYPASAVRSAIMAMLVLYAQKIGRLTQAGNFLIFAAAIMVAINPKILMSDVGFQLSFMAVWGLIYLSPFVKEKFSFVTDKFELQEIISATVSAQLATLPLMLFYFGRFSFLSLVANLLILPLAPLMMVMGMIEVLLAAWFLPAAIIFGWPLWLLCWYWFKVAEFLAGLPISNWGLGQINIWGVVILYGLLFLSVWFLRRAKAIIKT